MQSGIHLEFLQFVLRLCHIDLFLGAFLFQRTSIQACQVPADPQSDEVIAGRIVKTGSKAPVYVAIGIDPCSACRNPCQQRERWQLLSGQHRLLGLLIFEPFIQHLQKWMSDRNGIKAFITLANSHISL
ncbi:hypothetical protein D3C85_1291760 [compost metagenome]